MSLNINFDQNWNYCQRVTTNDDNIDALDNLSWLPVDLPHIITVNGENIFNNNKQKWWYRKQFQIILSDQQSNQSILLTFKSSDHIFENMLDSITSSFSIIVWLDTVKIFSDSITNSKISIELSRILLDSDRMKNHNQTHTLIVCSINNCLSLDVFLTVPLNTTCFIREVSFNPTVQNTSNLNQKWNGIHHYDALVDGVDTTVKDIHMTSNKILENTTNRTDKLLTINHLLVPYITIVMLIVGTRGDVQPFIAYGKALRAAGHRVRLATHEKFRKFVRDHGLEFFPLNGDPTEIMSFMVENNGIIPSVKAVLQNNLFEKRHVFFDILNSSWLACISNDDETGARFQAEAIIANPISYGHIHCAQKLGIPLHMAFTMPSSPTGAFPHPLSTISYSKIPREQLNIFSYSMVEAMMWAGIGDLINEFRQDVLGLPMLHVGQATSVMVDEEVPFTYCWSPLLVPRPLDWPHYIDVSGYFFLDLATDYVESNDDLLRFLGLSSSLNKHTREKSSPIFVGFGSITGHDSQRLLKMVLEALRQTGYRAILSGFDVNTDDLPETVFKIDDIPYDWLFQHVSAVCHHGGAGTTAAGLLAGKPTITIPFFGDQFFWGHVIERSGVGPCPIPGKELTIEKLVKAFQFVHQPVVQNAARRVQKIVSQENGCTSAVRSFHANLPLLRMRSDLEPTFPACFRLDEFDLQVSRPVAQVLLSTGVVNESQFKYHFTKVWRSEQDHVSSMSTLVRPKTINFQLNPMNTKPFTSYYFKTDPKTSANQSCYDSKQSSLHISNDSILTLIATESNQNKYDSTKANSSINVNVMERTTMNTSPNTLPSPLLNIDGLQEHDSHDISTMLHNASTISGYPPEVCRHILFEFIKIKTEHQHMQSFSLTNKQSSHRLTIRRNQLFTNLLALSGVLLDIICSFSAVLLDMSVYDKIPPPSNRYRILSWLFSRWF